MRIADIKETGLDIICENQADHFCFMPVVYAVGDTYSNYSTIIGRAAIISASEFLKINK